MNYKEQIKPEDRVIRSYLRVSSQRQKNEKTIKTQDNALKNMVKGKFGPEVAIQKAYKDDGFSGTNMNRPGLQALRRDLKDASWNTLVMFSGDRLSRDFNDGDKLMQEIINAGKEIFYADGTSPNNNPRLVNRVLSAVYDDEWEKTLRRMREGKLTRAVVDKAINQSKAAYGLKLIPKRGTKASPDFEQTSLKVVEGNAEVVRKIFHQVGNERYTVPKLILWLKEHGIKSPTGNDTWSTSTLYSLLHNEIYIGKARYGSSEAIEPRRRQVIKTHYEVPKSSRRIKPKEEWIYIEKDIPKILEGEEGLALFERVQKQLTQNKRVAASGSKTKTAYLFANLMTCECGYSRNGSGSAEKKNIYYTCSERKAHYPQQACYIGGVNVRVADEYLWNELVSVLTDPLELCKGVKAYFDKELQRDDLLDSEVLMLQSTIKELEKKQMRIEEAYEAGEYDVTKLSQKLKPVNTSLDAAKTKLAAITPEQEVDIIVKPNDDLLDNIIAYAPDALKALSFEEKRAIVMESVSKIVAVPGNAVIYGSVPVQEGALLNRRNTLKLKGNKANIATPYYVYLKTISRNCWTS